MKTKTAAETVLIDRIKEEKLFLNQFSLNKIDSLVYLDSTTVSGYFNEKKISFNLINQKAAIHWVAFWFTRHAPF